MNLNKLPSLTLEPSHSARLMTAIMLCYIRCLEIKKGNKINFKELLIPSNRWITLLYLWSMFTMGSGTAFIGLGILSLYFIQRNTAVYFIPIIAGLIFLGNQLEIKQLDRAYRVTLATVSGNSLRIMSEDGSAASRIVPLLNTLTLDWGKKETWIGHGTYNKEDYQKDMWNNDQCVGCVYQYGLIPFIISLVLVYTCMIRKVFSIETLVFILLLGMSLNNIAYIWGILMLFTMTYYFKNLISDVKQ
jgi:hypothetical protein